MKRFGLECLLIFNSVFGLYAAENSVHRVSRQDFNTNGAFGELAASYQQPFESRNGVYRVQRQDFTNTNDVPFTDSYQNLYVNRFSKLNYESGNVNRSFTPLPKLFLPAALSRVENPYFSIGLPNYDRVVPASNFGEEFQTRSSAPTRVTLRPQITIQDENRYDDDAALPAISNSQHDFPLPSISEYSKSSSFDKDFSSIVEQFEMTEDRKSICKSANCRRSSNDGVDANKPIRKRSLDYEPYYSFSKPRYPWQRTEFVSHLKNPYHMPYPFYDHDNDRIYSQLNYLLKNRIPTFDASTSNSEESATSSLSDSVHSEESSSSDINSEPVEVYPENKNIIKFSRNWKYETSPEPESDAASGLEHSDSYNFEDLESSDVSSDDDYHQPIRNSEFNTSVKELESESEQETTAYDLNLDDKAPCS